MHIVLELLSNFSDFYFENNELQKSQKIISERKELKKSFTQHTKQNAIIWTHRRTIDRAYFQLTFEKK